MPNTKNVTISYKSIIRVILVLMALYVLIIIKDIVAILFMSIVLAAAFDPWVDWLQKRHIPRSVSIIAIYVIMVGILSLAVVLIIPPIAEQIGQLAQNLPNYYSKIAGSFSKLTTSEIQSTFPSALETLSANLGQTTRSVFSTVTGVFGGIISFFVVLVIVFYITVEEDMLKKTVNFFVPPENKAYISGLIDRMQKKLGMWLRGQLSLCIIIGLMTWIGLTMFGIKYALILAIVAGVLEVIPFAGPMLASIPAILVGLSDSIWKAVIIGIMYFVIQQIENHMVVPLVMQKAVGLNPIIVIVAVMIGVKIGGFVGALLAVPVAAALGVFLSDLYMHRHKETQVK